MRGIILLILVMLAAVGAPVQAEVVPGNSTSGSQAYWNGLIHKMKVPAPSTTITVFTEYCPYKPDYGEAEGCYYDNNFLYLNPSSPRATQERTFYHELGHAFDDEKMTTSAKTKFAKLMKVPGANWTTELPKLFGDPLNEVFADAYMQCALYGSKSFHGNANSYSYAPSKAVHTKVCKLIVSL